MIKKEALINILRQSVSKYFTLTYSEIKYHLDNATSISEFVDLYDNGNQTYAQMELQPIYEIDESEEKEIVASFNITDGLLEFTCTICYPEYKPPYCSEYIAECIKGDLPKNVAKMKGHKMRL